MTTASRGRRCASLLNTPDARIVSMLENDKVNTQYDRFVNFNKLLFFGVGGVRY